jgi:ArsR family transcriptional regulator
MTRAADPEVRLLHALADPTRLAIVHQLHIQGTIQGTVCACDFAICCRQLSQPTVSYHLKVLRQAGIIQGQRCGTWVWYSLNHQALDPLVELTTRLVSVSPQVPGSASEPG